MIIQLAHGGFDTVIKVAIAGVGNCASALVQGVEFYKNIEKDEDIPGVMHAYCCRVNKCLLKI